MHIRRLQKTDNAHYSELWHKALIEQDEYFRISSEDEPSPQIQTTFSDDSFSLGAFVNTSLVGSVSIERDSRTKLNHKALLFRMFVHPSVSGQGIGVALVNEALSQARCMEALRQVYLTVLANNHRAIKLYAAAGFEIFAHEAKSVKIKNAYIDELQMVRFLSNSGPHHSPLLNSIVRGGQS